MERHAKLFIFWTLIAIAIIGLSYYAYSQSREYLAGPSIKILEPENGATLNSQFITIKGIASNISFISLNNAQIFVDDKGLFSEKLLLSPGYNIMKVSAKDRFNRVVEKTLEVVYKQNITN